MAKCIILRGTSGSGKSTYAKKFPHAAVVSADFWFQGDDGLYHFDAKELGNAHDWCMRRFVYYITTCTDKEMVVVVDNTNTSLSELVPYAAVAKAHGFDVEIHNFWVDLDICAQRNRHGVDLKTIERQFQRMKQDTRNIPKWFKQTDHGEKP